MSDDTKDMLSRQVDSVAETIREYARQIESGEYGQTWTVYNADGDVVADDARGSDDADVLDGFGNHTDEWTAEHNQEDEPTIVDESGNETPISGWPLEVVVKVGRPLAVVIATGGPHIEIVHDLSDGSAKLAGYWGGEQEYRYGKEFQTVLDYLTETLWDEVPEDWK